MAYRDDRQALAMQIAELERDNQKLREKLEAATRRFERSQLEQSAERTAQARKGCMACGGTLLPVAIFAGHDITSPLPLKMSTLRFVDPNGGFTHSAPLHSMACASCGFIHNFIDMQISVESLDPR